MSGCGAGKVSESVISLKKEVVGFLSQHMAASNLASDEGTYPAVWQCDRESIPFIIQHTYTSLVLITTCFTLPGCCSGHA